MTELHWNERYSTPAAASRSWYTPEPTTSLALLDHFGLDMDSPIVDVGGGDSFLVDRLVARGFRDVSVLDISSEALDAVRRRLGDAVHCIRTDVLAWTPERSYDVWHDRAAFHFLTTPEHRRRYLDALRAAVPRGGHVIIGTFAADGPPNCSGLPVERYDPDRLAATFGDDLRLLSSLRQEHTTPTGAIQPFTWAVFERVESV